MYLLVYSGHSLHDRLKMIIEFLKTTETYETLSLSHIEGIETFNSRFNLLTSGLKKKTYDILEHRKEDFEIDFKDFILQLRDLGVSKNIVRLLLNDLCYL